MTDITQADIDAAESILWVDTIIDDKEAIAKAFARHRQHSYDQGYYDGCANPIVRYDALRKALKRIANLKWDTMAQGCNAACEAAKIAEEALGQSK